MKAGFIIPILLASSMLCANAQSGGFREQYEAFKQQSRSTHESFRSKCNKSYADFLEKSWKSYSSVKVEKPKDEMLPPVVYDPKTPVEDKPVVIKDTVAPIPQEPQPQPVEPVVPTTPTPPQEPVAPVAPEVPAEPEAPVEPVAPEEPVAPVVPVAPVAPEEPVAPSLPTFSFKFYGDSLAVRYGEELRFHLPSTDGNNVAVAWINFSEAPSSQDLLYDCLAIRKSRSYCDWAYLQMLYSLSIAFQKTDDEAALMTAWLLCQSGYKVRVARSDKGLCFLFCSKYTIYGARYFFLDGEKFYCMGSDAEKIEVADRCTFPREKALSFDMSSSTKFAPRQSEPRKLKAKKFASAAVTSTVNSNLIKFYTTYPDAQYGDNFMTRWAMHANVPLEDGSKEAIYPSLRTAIEGKTPLQSANILLNFVQTAFEYELDDKVWGYDRAFFAEETLYYKYCDCEDRSILFSRLVRDLLGLDVVLVYYPGHLATAVRFNEDVTGDYIQTSSGKYTVCDPTYIGAPVGATMTGMDNSKATVILLGR